MAAKTEYPEMDTRYIHPKAAWSLMKAAQNVRQTVYITGGVGYGKTALVANFLGRKRYTYCSAASGEAMEQLEQIPADKDITVVLDDLHCLDTQELRDRYLPLISRLVSDHRVWLILVSRAAIPGWLKALHIRHVFVQIGQEALALSPQEQAAFLDAWQLAPTAETQEALRTDCEGIPLLLRINAIGLQKLSGISDPVSLREQEQTVLAQTKGDFLDYMERNVWSDFDLSVVDFLMELSVVDRFDLPMAQSITKRADAAKMLLYAQELGSFLGESICEGKTWYTIRWGMRESLLRRLERTCTKGHISALYSIAGAACELAGETVAALAMYEKSADQQAVSRLLVQNSRKYAGAAHYWEFRRYYLALPEAVVKASPELMAGMSMLQSILLNDEESERWYQALSEFAAGQSGSMRRAAKARLLYLDIGLPHRGSLKMVDIFKNGGAFLAEHKALLPEFSLTNNQPSILNGGKDFTH